MSDAAGMNGALATEQSQDVDLLEVDILEVKLPCRGYEIRYKVAESSDFSLTTEFLLRLLRLTDGIAEDEVGEFFGFSGDEIRFVVDHAESRGYVARRAGRIYLTSAGHALFVGDEPRLFEVRGKQDRFNFDLISLSPADPRRSLSNFEYGFPEVRPLNDLPGHASRAILRSFTRHFETFRLKSGGSRLEKQTLYTVDQIQPENRYSALVPISVAVRRDDPGAVEASLLDWKSGPELDEREAVVQSCATFVRGIRARSSILSKRAAELFVASAPEQLEHFFKGGILDVEGLYRSVLKQAGELRVDRATVRTVGSLWTKANKLRFAAAIKYAVAREAKMPPLQVWMRPNTAYWGSTTRLEDLLAALSRQSTGEDPDADGGNVRAVTVGEESTSAPFKLVFNGVINVPAAGVPSGLEAFVVPGVLCFVAVHTPVGCEEGYPIPLGILSFDDSVVARGQRLLLQVLDSTHAVVDHCDWKTQDLVADVTRILRPAHD